MTVQPNNSSNTVVINVVFAFRSPIMDGPCLVLYQQLMSGRIDWQAPVVSAEASDKAGSFTRSRNWAELKSAFLDCFMPSNSVEESALRLATFKQAHQTVSAYYLRFQSECTRFEGG